MRFSLACSSEEGNSSLFQTRPGSYSSAGLKRANKADDLLRARLRTVYVEVAPVFIGCCGVLTPCHTHSICSRQLSEEAGCRVAHDPGAIRTEHIYGLPTNVQVTSPNQNSGS